MEATLELKASPSWPISSVLLTRTLAVRSLLAIGFDGDLEPVEARRDLAGENHAGQNAKQQYEECEGGADPSGAIGCAGDVLGFLSTEPGIKVEVV